MNTKQVTAVGLGMTIGGIIAGAITLTIGGITGQNASSLWISAIAPISLEILGIITMIIGGLLENQERRH